MNEIYGTYHYQKLHNAYISEFQSNKKDMELREKAWRLSLEMREEYGYDTPEGQAIRADIRQGMNQGSQSMEADRQANPEYHKEQRALYEAYQNKTEAQKQREIEKLQDEHYNREQKILDHDWDALGLNPDIDMLHTENTEGTEF